MGCRLSRLKLALCTLICALASPAVHADLFLENFDSPFTGSGPDNFFSFGNQLRDWGVSSAYGFTSPGQAAFYTMDFDDTGFGIGAARENISLVLASSNRISVAVRLQSGTAPGGFVAFRLEDADGTVVRTADSDLMSAGSSFQTLQQYVSNLTTVDYTGTTVGLDLSHISRVGLLFFDRVYSGQATVVFDDLRIVSVPEPNSAFLLVCIASVLGLSRSTRRRDP